MVAEMIEVMMVAADASRRRAIAGPRVHRVVARIGAEARLGGAITGSRERVAVVIVALLFQ